jgi:hypothetical protein
MEYALDRYLAREDEYYKAELAGFDDMDEYYEWLECTDDSNRVLSDSAQRRLGVISPEA